MTEQYHRVDDVYGIRRDVPLNYVARDAVDLTFIDHLAVDKHIVIYGSSKQGKTCLRKHCLEDSDYILVQSASKWDLKDVLTAVLKRAGFQITQSEKKTASGTNKIMASIRANWLAFGGTVTGAKESTKATETTTSELELDPSDVNDIISALKSIEFKKYIVIEDFHYLSVETQKDFAIALKAFHEASELSFIVVGVWLEENRLLVYNGDLTGRVVTVNADKWESLELEQVIDDGAALLNISFTDDFKQRLIEESFDSVYIVQDVCHRACEKEGVRKTQDTHKTIGQGLDVWELVREAVDQQSGRYRSFMIQFAEGFQTTRLEMYKWLVLAVLTAQTPDLEKGLKFSTIREALKSKHPEGQLLNTGNITQALQSTASLQIKKDIKPIIFDYDETNLRLNVVDRGFLIWLEHQSRDALFELIELTPTSEEPQQELDL